MTVSRRRLIVTVNKINKYKMELRFLSLGMRHNGMALAEKSSLEILVPEVANNVLCSVVDSKTNTFLVSPFYSVIIVKPS